ncbi:MAG: hypothetical protein ACP5FH_05075 [Terracidiphilus sp.]
MNRPILVCALFLLAAAALGAQEATESNPYEGVSNPPPNDTIVISRTPQAKPPAGVPVQASQPAQPQSLPSQAPPATASTNAYANPDGDIVSVPPEAAAPAAQPALVPRSYASDPDGHIVHLPPPPPGVLPAGTPIRTELLSPLSTMFSVKGQVFRARVVTDVLSGNQIVIPAGAEIVGQVTDVSTGHVGGHGILRLWPETLVLPGGRRCRLMAELVATPGSHAEVSEEGTVQPGSRLKRDSIEYGGTVGGGAIAGAYLGGPVGALAGGLVGAGVITTHLLVSHPQASLRSGAVLVFSLSEPMKLNAAGVLETMGPGESASLAGSND